MMLGVLAAAGLFRCSFLKLDFVRRVAEMYLMLLNLNKPIQKREMYTKDWKGSVCCFWLVAREMVQAQ